MTQLSEVEQTPVIDCEIKMKKEKKDKKKKKRSREEIEDVEAKTTSVEDNDEPEKKKKKKDKKSKKEVDDIPEPSGSTTADIDASPMSSCSSFAGIISSPEPSIEEEEEEVIAETKPTGIKSTAEIRKENNIRVYKVEGAGNLQRRTEVKDETTFKPFTSWENCGENFPKDLIQTLSSKFEKPSPIQMQAWPIALSGSNMVGIAETGSGKTLAFLLPGMVPAMQTEHKNIWAARAPTVLVLAPTRELVGQIHDEAVKFSANKSSSPLRCVQVVGGMPKGPQIRELKWGCDVLIATPGRLLDLYEMNCGLDLSNVSYFVLDEADRMLDMGFEKPLKEIKERCTYENKQILMFSATWPREIQKLAREILGSDWAQTTRPLTQLFIGEDVESGTLKANKKVSQEVFVMHSFEDKKSKLREILDNHGALTEEMKKEGLKSKPKVIIFGRTKRGVDELSKTIEYEMGHWPLSIHGDKEQRDRDWALREFKKEGGSEYNILVATDVAARGIDVKGVSVVINFDFPMQIEDYVHRIGRTGRGGESGKSFSFFQERDCTNPGKMARQLTEILRGAEQEVPEDLRKIGGQKGGGKGFKGKGKGKGKRRW